MDKPNHPREVIVPGRGPVLARPVELLTADEHDALKLTGALWNLVGRIVADGRSRPADLAEISIHIHNLQHAILAQAAARAYPDRYRLLGGTIETEAT